MYARSLNIIKKHSFFLFGARGTGKSSYIQRHFSEEEALYVDLLLPREFDVLNRDPEELSRRISALPNEQRWIIIDEVQRIPKLLNLVHHHIERSNVLFGLTGSSARKLKRGAANLLAGRALIYSLFPLTHVELGTDFDLLKVLSVGSLPGIFTADPTIQSKMLSAYTHAYLREEVQAEQLVRAIDPFHLFLAVAGQMSGKLINYSAIARESGVSDRSIKEYFQILEDTLLGFHLLPFHESIRKRQRHSPKFYIFDEGIQRSLASTLSIPLKTGTSMFGDAFERWLICEVYRLIKYADNDYHMSYLRTKDDAELDLILQRPGLPNALIEIKSTDSIRPEHVSNVKRFARDMGNAEAFILSRDPHSKIIDGINILPWRQGLQELGLC
ncbi:MAG: ATP-binding protein [Bdellovibrionales bacterium]|nr:ATP-binding protein [Bdellovibrionales bacterium]